MWSDAERERERQREAHTHTHTRRHVLGEFRTAVVVGGGHDGCLAKAYASDEAGQVVVTATATATAVFFVIITLVGSSVEGRGGGGLVRAYEKCVVGLHLA